MQIFYALGAGISVGVLFTWLKLPLPAPPTLTGIMGAAGVFLGSVLFTLIKTRIFN
jgi:XapX domain-containing protein